MIVRASEVLESDDGITDDDLIWLEQIRKSPVIEYDTLFFLYEFQDPCGWNEYDGYQFSD